MKLSIEKAVYGGLGLARMQGKTVFVPLTLPEEQVEAHIAEEKRSFAMMELDAVLTSSPHRVDSLCPYFARCGGCQYQHADYAGQLKIKQDVLVESLRRAGVQEIPEIEVISAEPWHYRNRIRLLVKPGDRAGLAYRGWKSHETIAVELCPIAAPLLERAIRVLAETSEETRLSDWAREVELFCDAEEKVLLLSVTVKRTFHPDVLQSSWKALVQHLPELSGISAFASGKGKDEDLRGALLAQYGETSLSYRVGGYAYQVSAGSFFQVNRFLVHRLVELVTKKSGGQVAWDLYAGVGLFARALADRFERVIAVESASSSSSDLRHNLPAPHEHVRKTTLDFLRRHPSNRKPELIVVDPPRAGLDKEVTGLLREIASERIVYVSCDPATLGRDLNALLQAGYRLRTLNMVDLFPQTFHMESVVELER